MKKISLLIVVVTILLTACTKDPAVNAKKDTNTLSYSNSYKAWINYKQSIHNSYSYTAITSSFTGYGTTIKIGVKNGVIISRDFTSYQYQQNNKTIIKQWHEDATTLNSHGEESGELMTMDDIYAKAKNVWLKVDPKANDIYFETKNNGIISSCGYYPLGCQDDCFTGINIDSVTALDRKSVV